jgi:hypothetical protein
VKGARRWSSLVCLVALLTTACGSRLTTEEIRAQGAVSEDGSGFRAGDAVAADDDSSTGGDTTGTTVAGSAGGTGKKGTSKSGSSGAVASSGARHRS